LIFNLHECGAMDLTHVRHFVQLGQTLHFGKAALDLGIAQPQLSRSIQKLEHALGVTLFTRTTRQIALTPAGAVFLEEARKLVAQADTATRLAQRAQQAGTARLRVGFAAPALAVLPSALRAFRRDWPEVEVAIEQGSSEAQIAGLLAGSLDLALLSGAAAARATGVAARSLMQSRFLALLPADWPLAKKRSVRLAELATLPFVMAPADRAPEVHSAVLLACRDAGFAPRIVQESPQAYAIEALVASGVGLTLQPELWSVLRLDGVAYLPVKDLPDYLHWELAVAWRQDGAAVRAREAFVAAVLQAAER